MSLMNILSSLTRGPDQMDRMMDVFGVREALAEKPHAPEITRRATLRCMACGDKEACAAWLDAEHGEDVEVPAFCRNAGLISRLARQVELAA